MTNLNPNLNINSNPSSNPNLKILAIDTSTDACSVACYCHGKIFEHFEITPYKHSQFILEFIKKVLAVGAITLAQLDAIAFTCGPGSFTGLRLAASVVQGLAFAHNLPVIPISTLQVMAQGAYEEYQAEKHQEHYPQNHPPYSVNQVLVGIDARMQEIYWGAYQLDEAEQREHKRDERWRQQSLKVKCERYMVPLIQDQIVKPDEVVMPLSFSALTAIGVGNAWEVYRDLLQTRCQTMCALNASRFSGLAPVDPSSLEFPRGGASQASGMYKDIHEHCEQKRQQSETKLQEQFCPRHKPRPEGREAGLRSAKPKCEGSSFITKTDYYPHAHHAAKLAVLAYQKGLTAPANEALPVYLRDNVVKK